MHENPFSEFGHCLMAFAASCLVGGWPASGQAALVAFDFGTTAELSVTSYTEAGMTFTASPGAHFHNMGAGETNVLYFHQHGGDSFLEMTLGGAPFDLTSMEVRVVTSNSSSTLPTFTASNGSVVSAPWALGTFVFPAGWAGITSVTWDVDDPLLGGETMAIDNLVFVPSTSVPGATPLVLVGAGLAAGGIWRARTRPDRPCRTPGRQPSPDYS